MPDYSATALEDVKEQITHAAIRMAMADLGWYGSAEDGFQGNAWEEMLPPVSGPTGSLTLRENLQAYSQHSQPPPGSEYLRTDYNQIGNGFNLYRVDPWNDIYEPWIERIDAAFEGWEGLPEPSDYDDPIDSLRSAVSALTPMPAGGSGNDPGGDFDTEFAVVDLEANLDLLDDWVGPATAGASSGLLVFAFDEAYGAGRIRPVMRNQAQAAVVLGVTLLGEQQIWRKTRDDIMTLAAEAVEAFEPYGGGVSIDLKVVKAFVDLLNTFAPGPLKTVLTVGSSALGLVDTLLPEEQTSDVEARITGDTAEEVYTSLCEAIEKLERQVYNKEYDLVTSLRGLLGVMREGRASQFHIHPDSGMAADLAEAESIDVDPEYLRLVGFRTVPTIAAFMGQAAEHAQGADRPGIWQRSGYIGYGSAGAYYKWAEALAAFDAVTTGSGAELVEAGALLAAGAGFLEDADGSAEEAIRGVEDDLERGRLEWDNSGLGLPPPRPAGVIGGPIPY